MTVIIEVANEAGGVGTVKRTVLRSADYKTPKDLEAAAVEFIRSSSSSNEAALQKYDSATG